MLHPSAALGSERLETPHPTAVPIHRTLFNAHNTAAVAELEHAVHGINITADHATPSAQFAVKWGDDRRTAWYQYQGSFYGMHNTFFHTDAPATSWSTSVGYIGLQTACSL
jgi:hypothetical protein